jgi:arsenate reductase (glutaredoxin)
MRARRLRPDLRLNPRPGLAIIGCMTEVTLYHNPRCSKSRAALALLASRGIEPRIVAYLETPPNREELAALVRKLGVDARRLLRSGEPEYAALGLDDPALGDTALLDAIATHPRLLERPIAVRGDRAVIGRPPERVLELF